MPTLHRHIIFFWLKHSLKKTNQKKIKSLGQLDIHTKQKDGLLPKPHGSPHAIKKWGELLKHNVAL